MIQVTGSVSRSFVFPAELPITFAYYSDLGRILTYLPHITLVRAYSYNRFRVLYATTELSTYRVRIYCDLQADLDAKKQTLGVHSLDVVTPVKAQAGLRSTTAQGFYGSRSVFAAAGDQTRIEYSLELHADLPIPLGLRFMPGAVVNRIAQNVTSWRIREIAEGFIERSIDAFPHWLAELGQPHLPAL